ncbi:MAG: hypothetical protein KME40_33300 [Komarekiella atlantica HA4396-MV6]|jgi:hypothetical protein|nr:hypothetical protein [Komarekiella atlantica HA4396-MV6]
MKSQENQTAENKPDYRNPQKLEEAEPITQVQKNSVITKKDLPDARLRYGFPLLILTIFLFVAAIYYGIIKP